MNVLRVSLLTCLISFISHAQSHHWTNNIASMVNDLPMITETADVKADHWKHTVFNAYKDVDVKFPIQLKFDDSLYAAPIGKEMVVTSRYGWRRGRPHKGIDIDLITGDEVRAMLGGVVRFARYNSGHGRTVIVRHFNGLETAYAHLSKYAVKENDTVVAGQVLGKGGATGNARGSHLHLVVSYKGVAINPEYIFDFSESNKIRAQEMWVTKRWTTPYLHSSRQRTKPELFGTLDEALASYTREKKIYIVKKGDTLSAISRRNNVSIRSIVVANNLKSASKIRVGQKLVID